VLELMRKYGAPMDRESYIHFATQQSSRLDSGARDMLPHEVQGWSQFEGCR